MSRIAFVPTTVFWSLVRSIHTGGITFVLPEHAENHSTTLIIGPDALRGRAAGVKLMSCWIGRWDERVGWRGGEPIISPVLGWLVMADMITVKTTEMIENNPSIVTESFRYFEDV